MPKNLSTRTKRLKNLRMELVRRAGRPSTSAAKWTRLAALLMLIVTVAAGDLPSSDAGVHAANAWLKLVDQRKYAQSWQDASSFFRSQISQDRWESRINEVRTPLGPLVARKLSVAEPTTTLPGSPDGHYLVLQYQSSFAQQRSAIETVVMMLDHDGLYRTAGYFIR
jgi:hypothetical protein